jgi:hypothetical protein
VGSLREQTRLCGKITCSGNKCNVQVWRRRKVHVCLSRH